MAVDWAWRPQRRKEKTFLVHGLGEEARQVVLPLRWRLYRELYGRQEPSIVPRSGNYGARGFRWRRLSERLGRMLCPSCFPCSSSLDQAARVCLEWVGWASAGVRTLGWVSLAVGTGASQRQAKLMQRGPIIASPVEGGGCSCAGCSPAVPARRWGNGSGGSLGPGTAAQPGPKAVRCQPALTQEGNMPFMEAPRSLACACTCAISTGRRVTADAVLQLFLMARRSPGQMERKGKGKGGA